MNTITDDDLTLLFYGEHDDPALAARVAESDQLTTRYDALCKDLRIADSYVPPQRGDDYGSEVWKRISPRLGTVQTQSTGRISTWLSSLAPSSLTQARFSLAGALSLVLVAVLAFTLGRNAGQESISEPPNTVNSPALVVAELDSSRLLSHSVSAHLEQLNLMLTQFVNATESSTNEAEYATDMLVANRLYRQAAVAQGEHKLAAFLTDLEPLLIELAYEAQKGSPLSRERMQQEVNNGLLFRVRLMNTQLNKPQIST